MFKIIALALALLPCAASAAQWKLDPATTVTVDVGWHGSTVKVNFPTVSGDVEFDQNKVETAKAKVMVATTDATTGVGLVDDLVRSADYLGAGQYPEITFQLDKLKQTSKSTADVTGRITMRGVTKPARFNATVFKFGPSSSDPDKFEAGFDLTGEIDRTQFGSTGGLPDVAAVLPVQIHLLMSSK